MRVLLSCNGVSVLLVEVFFTLLTLDFGAFQIALPEGAVLYANAFFLSDPVQVEDVGPDEDENTENYLVGRSLNAGP